MTAHVYMGQASLETAKKINQGHLIKQSKDLYMSSPLLSAPQLCFFFSKRRDP